MASAMIVLSVALLLVLVQVISGQRIADQKCAEFRKNTVKETIKMPVVLSSRVAGETAKPHEFPHHALLGWKKLDEPNEYRFDCGGSLISERFVLTAAHCLKYKKPHIVRLGEHNLNDNSDNQMDFMIEWSQRHPLHRHRHSYHDIALVKLDADVIFSEVIRPACLWTGMNMNVSSVIVTGFGDTEIAGYRSEKLQKARLDILDKQECQAIVVSSKKFKDGIIDAQLCVGSKRGGEDTCQGDSGGPIQVMVENAQRFYHVVGVTSTGAACGIGRSASIYTRVASYIDWIEDIVWISGLKVVKSKAKICHLVIDKMKKKKNIELINN